MAVAIENSVQSCIGLLLHPPEFIQYVFNLMLRDIWHVYWHVEFSRYEFFERIKAVKYDMSVYAMRAHIYVTAWLTFP